MSYTLQKPCSDEDKDNFIMHYNWELRYTIYETKEAIYALEPNEIVQDGEIIINPNYEEELLNKAKFEKLIFNDELRDAALIQGVTYQDILFDSDTDQKVNLLATVTTMTDEDTIVWYGMNNDHLECTKADLFAIGQMIINLHSFCWTKNATIKQAIEDATTIEEVEAIEIDYTL